MVAELGLSEAELQDFRARGVSGTFRHPLLGTGSQHARRIVEAYSRLEKSLAFPGPTHVDMERRLDGGALWFQSTFSVVPEIRDVVSHPALVERVASILGDDLLVWATTVARKRPGDVHSWHTDTARWEGVTAFIGLDGMSLQTVVKVMSHTHRLQASPFDLIESAQFTNAVRESPLTDEETVVEAARTLEPKAEIVAHDLHDGEFFLFDGCAWHGSRNTGGATRYALAVFYARPDADIRIPTAFGREPVWYAHKPPCLLVRGKDRFRVNRFIEVGARGALTAEAE